MKKSQYCPTIILTGLIFLSYSSVILAQSSENPYITDRGLLELRNVLNDSLSEIAKENRYTLHEDYTYLGIPESNIIITFSGGIISGIALGIGILGSPISPEVFATVVTLVSLVAVMSNFYSPGTN